MDIINAKLLFDFAKNNPNAAGAINRWVEIVKTEKWKHHNDLKQTFPQADYVGNNRYVFNIAGNNYRLVAAAVFFAGALHIRFIGTHAQYDKIDCSTI
ncbi:toxin RelE [Bacteroidia bacterium]|nr:toxin RelE [Bacteroidia bacterium]